GNRVAVVSHHEGISKTFSELNDEVNLLAAGLYNKLGVRRGDVVGLWSLNSYNWIVAEYAAMRLGAIVCTINPVYKMSELEYVLKSGLVKCLFMPGLKSKQEKANNFYDLISKSEYVNSSSNNLLKHVVHMDGECPKQKFGNVFAHPFTTLYDNNRINKEVVDAVDTDDPCFIMELLENQKEQFCQTIV
ncbi:acyl-CoA synthetase-like protein, partial [Leptotrombidium deliense]